MAQQRVRRHSNRMRVIASGVVCLWVVTSLEVASIWAVGPGGDPCETVPLNARILWTGTAAAIPTGWTRDTDFNDRYLQGAGTGVNPGTNAGGLHGHTADAHAHTQNSHTHTLSVTGAAVGTIDKSGGTSVDVAEPSHTHADTESEGATATTSSGSSTISITTAHPPFVRVIVLKPDDANKNIPVDGIVFTAQAAPPTDFELTDGNNSTTNLSDTFIRGATSSGDGGGTGGAATHDHNGVSHGHTQLTHGHADSPFDTSGGFAFEDHAVGGGRLNVSVRRHHEAQGISSTGATNQTTAVTVNTASSEPVYVRLLGIQNRGASAATPEHVILPYTGTLASIGGRWSLYQPTEDQQIKVTVSSVQIGGTGGSNTHTHTTVGHTHTQDAHGHTFSVGVINTHAADSGTDAAKSSHTHTSFDLADATATNQNTTVTLNTGNGRTSYREVVFIKCSNVSVHLKGGHIKGALIQ